MFKIFDHDDGSTTIFCSDTGDILCSVHNKQVKPLAEIQPPNSLRKLKKNKGPLSKKKRSKAIGCPIPRKVKTEQSSSMVNDSKYFKTGYGANLQCNIQALPWVNGAEAIVAGKCKAWAKEDLTLDQDINVDSITKPEFLQIVGLCPKPMAEDGTWKDLQEKLPARSISHPLKAGFDIGNPEVSETKVYEDCGISAPLARKWLKETPEGQKRKLNKTGLEMSLKKCETFCKFAIGSPYPAGNGSHYSMRCRETKKYPVTFKPTKTPICHKYCFTLKDHIERRKYLRTGLNQRSRKLQREVCQRTPVLKLYKLTEEEIKRWTTRSSNPVSVDDGGSYSKLKFGSRCRQYPSTCRSLSRGVVNGTMQSLFTRECELVISDISEQFELKNDTIYLRGTALTVRRPAALVKHSLGNNMRRHDGISFRLAEMGHQDHPYYRTMSPKCVATRIKKHCEEPKSPSTPIPVIDLCSDDDQVPKNTFQSVTPSSFTFVFKCFGCNSRSAFKSKESATSAVKEHMVTYHAVAEPKAFLNVHLNKISKVLVIEAFPGYKHTNV